MSPLSFLHNQHLCYSMLENGDRLRDVDVISDFVVGICL